MYNHNVVKTIKKYGKIQNKKKGKFMRKQNIGVGLEKPAGITLGALVITIIVLLILAGVSLNLVARK